MRLGRRMRSTLGSFSIARQQPVETCVCVARAASKWICSERMPGVRSSNPASGCVLQLPRAAPAPGSATPGRAPARRTPPAGCSRRRGARRSRRAFARGRQFEQRRKDCRRAAPGCGMRWKRKLVARAQLPDLPELVVDDGDRADESAEAGAIGPEDHRHVAGEVDAADGVGVVVNVGRMQSRFAAVAARPGGLRADQPHAGAARVVVHFPFGVEERVDVFGREEVRRAVRAVGDTDLPRSARSSGARASSMAWHAVERRGRCGSAAARRRRAARGRRGRRTVRA